MDLFVRSDARLPTASRVVRAVRRWITLAAYLSTIGAVVYVASDGHAFARHGATISLVQVVSLYFVGCAIAGMIAGLLTPITRSLGGSILATVLSLLPVGAILSVTLLRTPFTDPLFWFTSLGFGLLIGTIYGAIDWHFREEGANPPSAG